MATTSSGLSMYEDTSKTEYEFNPVFLKDHLNLKSNLTKGGMKVKSPLPSSPPPPTDDHHSPRSSPANDLDDAMLSDEDTSSRFSDSFESPRKGEDGVGAPCVGEGVILCAWCGRVCKETTDVNHTLETTGGKRHFCGEVCFSYCKKASFKKPKFCDWCKQIKPTVSFVDFADTDQQLHFCSEKCLNQYKMHIFCQETETHLQLHPQFNVLQKQQQTLRTINATSLITPDLWMKDLNNGEEKTNYLFLPKTDDGEEASRRENSMSPISVGSPEDEASRDTEENKFSNEPVNLIIGPRRKLPTGNPSADSNPESSTVNQLSYLDTEVDGLGNPNLQLFSKSMQNQITNRQTNSVSNVTKVEVNGDAENVETEHHRPAIRVRELHEQSYAEDESEHEQSSSEVPSMSMFERFGSLLAKERTNSFPNLRPFEQRSNSMIYPQMLLQNPEFLQNFQSILQSGMVPQPQPPNIPLLSHLLNARTDTNIPMMNNHDNNQMNFNHQFRINQNSQQPPSNNPETPNNTPNNTSTPETPKKFSFPESTLILPMPLPIPIPIPIPIFIPINVDKYKSNSSGQETNASRDNQSENAEVAQLLRQTSMASPNKVNLLRSGEGSRPKTMRKDVESTSRIQSFKNTYNKRVGNVSKEMNFSSHKKSLNNKIPSRVEISPQSTSSYMMTSCPSEANSIPPMRTHRERRSILSYTSDVYEMDKSLLPNKHMDKSLLANKHMDKSLLPNKHMDKSLLPNKHMDKSLLGNKQKQHDPAGECSSSFKSNCESSLSFRSIIPKVEPIDNAHLETNEENNSEKCSKKRKINSHHQEPISRFGKRR